MKIVVLVKEVPDTEAQILLKDGVPDLASVNMVVNPYDEYAVEEALRLAEKHPGSTTTAVMIGREASKKNVVNVLALGIDEAVLVVDPALDGADGLQLSRVLKAAVAPLNPDVILAGKQGVDHDWGLAPIALAAGMDIAHAGIVTKLEITDATFRAESDGDDGKLITEGALPAVFTAEKALNEPRYASLKGIMKAKTKPLAVKSLADLGLDTPALGTAQVKFSGGSYPPKKKAGRIIGGETVQEKVATLVQALREEAKVI